jgi:spore coat protein U-like protein
MKLLRLFIIGAVTLIFSVIPVFAATKTATMRVTGYHLAIVTITTTNMDFGSFTSESGTVTANATITVNATAGAPYKVTLNGGNYSDKIYRYIQYDPSNKIPYNIYQPDGATLWGDNGLGDTFPAGYPLSGTGTGADQNYTAKGNLDSSKAAGKLPSVAYTDTVTVTIHY